MAPEPGRRATLPSSPVRIVPEVTRNTTISRRFTTVLAATAFAAPLAVAGPAAASGGSAVVNRSSCVGGGIFTLKAKHDDARVIEVDYEVDTNRVGQVWSVRLYHDRIGIYSGNLVTVAPSGSFTLRRTTGNWSGTDVIQSRAVHGSQVCGGRVAL